MTRHSRRRLFAGLALAMVLAGGLLAVPLAEDRALAAEEQFVADRLDGQACLTDWGTSEGTETKRASVTGVTPRGLQVTVRMPYAYATVTEAGTLHADTAAEATYLVSPTETHRLGGDSIDIC